jgi:thiol-disulfide isomerase/thioredoxin
MFKNSKQVALAACATIALTVGSIANTAPGNAAAPSAYQKNVDRMDVVLKSKPNDEAAHYYRAVSLQYMGEYKRAKSDYEWVVNNGRNPAFRQQSTIGLQGLMRTLYGVGMSAAPTGGSSIASAPPAASPAGAPAKTIAAATKIASAPGPKPKVYEFYTDWCHVCKSHASEYEELQGESSSKVDFQRLNAEDPANSDLVQKFGVHAYPTFVMVDPSGKAVFNEAGGYGKSQLIDLMGEKLGVKI